MGVVEMLLTAGAAAVLGTSVRAYRRRPTPPHPAVPHPELAFAPSRPGTVAVERLRSSVAHGGGNPSAVLDTLLDECVSPDPLERSWYLVDLARGVRNLGVRGGLPSLLRRADAALELPLAPAFAAELVCIPGFADYLQAPLSPPGQVAVRVLWQALRSIRTGQLPAGIALDVPFGDAVRKLADACPDTADPLVALAFLEALRLRRRTGVLARLTRGDAARRKFVRRQAAGLKAAEAVYREYLHDIADDLVGLWPGTGGLAAGPCSRR